LIGHSWELKLGGRDALPTAGGTPALQIRRAANSLSLRGLAARAVVADVLFERVQFLR
jgi:hypothetical protein